jgi:hypothetical protein
MREGPSRATDLPDAFIGGTELAEAKTEKIPSSRDGISSAPEGIRTPNLLIRSQMLYPLSYGR